MSIGLTVILILLIMLIRIISSRKFTIRRLQVNFEAWHQPIWKVSFSQQTISKREREKKKTFSHTRLSFCHPLYYTSLTLGHFFQCHHLHSKVLEVRSLMRQTLFYPVHVVVLAKWAVKAIIDCHPSLFFSSFSKVMN